VPADLTPHPTLPRRPGRRYSALKIKKPPHKLLVRASVAIKKDGMRTDLKSVPSDPYLLTSPYRPFHPIRPCRAAAMRRALLSFGASAIITSVGQTTSRQPTKHFAARARHFWVGFQNAGFEHVAVGSVSRRCSRTGLCRFHFREDETAGSFTSVGENLTERSSIARERMRCRLLIFVRAGPTSRQLSVRG